uniref:CUB domain-containing protein n=1 Tax=Syphacia muris TaxID=451379 RepID=A0A0N5ABA8_9BILA
MAMLLLQSENFDSHFVSAAWWSASGEMYYDEGDDKIDDINKYGKLCRLKFTFTSSSEEANLIINRDMCDSGKLFYLEKIVVLGQRFAPSSFKIHNSTTAVCWGSSSDMNRGTYSIVLDPPLNMLGLELAWMLKEVAEYSTSVTADSPSTTTPRFSSSSASSTVAPSVTATSSAISTSPSPTMSTSESTVSCLSHWLIFFTVLLYCLL